MIKILLEPERYIFPNGMAMQREETGSTPQGNPTGGRWVLRAGDGSWIDCDQYRADLAERHGLTLNSINR
jgi:hypothetical protein